jgi:hypothetical protein
MARLINDLWRWIMDIPDRVSGDTFTGCGVGCVNTLKPARCSGVSEDAF